MKSKKAFIINMLFLLIAFAACGGMGSGGGTTTFPVKYTDSGGQVIVPGATDVAVDTTFTATFVFALNSLTLEGNFFIVPVAKENTATSEYDSDTCNKDNALPSELIDCDQVPASSCTLRPLDLLSDNTAYSLCISTDAEYPYGGKHYEGSTLSFTTAVSS